jgi:hypothetical protein
MGVDLDAGRDSVVPPAGPVPGSLQSLYLRVLRRDCSRRCRCPHSPLWTQSCFSMSLVCPSSVLAARMFAFCERSRFVEGRTGTPPNSDGGVLVHWTAPESGRRPCRLRARPRGTRPNPPRRADNSDGKTHSRRGARADPLGPCEEYWDRRQPSEDARPPTTQPLTTPVARPAQPGPDRRSHLDTRSQSAQPRPPTRRPTRGRLREGVDAQAVNSSATAVIPAWEPGRGRGRVRRVRWRGRRRGGRCG